MNLAALLSSTRPHFKRKSAEQKEQGQLWTRILFLHGLQLK